MKTAEQIIHVDMSSLEAYSTVRPVYLAILGEPIELPNHCWASLLTVLVEYLIETENPYLKNLETALIYDGMSFYLFKEIHCIGCVETSTGKWLNTRYSDKELVIIVKALLAFCNITTSEVMIGYFKKPTILTLEKNDTKTYLNNANNTMRRGYLQSEQTYKNNDISPKEKKTFFMKDGKEYFDVKLSKIHLSVRAYNCLVREKIYFFSDIYNLSDMDILRIKNLGQKTFDEILSLKHSMSLIAVNSKESTIDSDKGKTFLMDDGKEYFDISIDEMKLSVRAYNCLAKQKILYFSDIYKLKENDLWKIQNLGKKTINEILALKKNTDLVLACNNVNIIPDICDYIFNSIEKMYIKNKENIREKIFHLIDSSFHKNLLNYLLQADFIHEILCGQVFQTLIKHRYGCEDVTIITATLPDFFQDEHVVSAILNDLMSAGKVKIIDKRYTAILPSVLDSITRVLSDRQSFIFEARLNSKTLEEIGIQHNLTRERIRQIEQKAITIVRSQNKKFAEDFLSEIFETYSFTKDEFLLVFDEDERTYNYLNLFYNKGEKTLEEALGDTGIPPYLLEKIKVFLLKASNSSRKQELFIYKLKNSISNIHCETNIDLKIQKNLNYHILMNFENIISKYFQNGFKIDSPIELHRFKKFYCSEFGSIDEHNIDFSRIKFTGVLFKNKVYIIEEKSIQKIINLIQEIIANENTIVYYKEFFEKNYETIAEQQSFSEDMVKHVIVNQFSQFVHKKNYFSVDFEKTTERELIKNELLRIWKDNVFLTYNDLHEKLPYIPLLKIQTLLFDDRDFIWNSQGEYTHFQKCTISIGECENINGVVSSICDEKGFASFANLSLDGILEQNFQFSTPALQSAIFRICLSENFERKGRIIVRKGAIENIETILKSYCSSLESITLKELIALERELTGTAYIWPALAAAHAVLVRVSKDLFVAENTLYFDVAQIDDSIDDFVLGDYLPTKRFSSFATFSHCGYAWNLFLLESYCRKFSDRYEFQTLSYNSRNVGAIVRKSCQLSYFDIMAHALVEADVTIEPSEIINFLYEDGYIGRRTLSKVDILIDMATTMRAKES